MSIDLINFDIINMRPKTHLCNHMRELDTPFLARLFENNANN